MSLPQKVQVCWQPLPWVLNKLCRQKIIGFSSVTIVILKSNFFFTATRAQHKRGLTELGSTGSWAAEPALKELIPATSKNQTGHLMKTFKTSSGHSETSEICIKSGFFLHIWMQVDGFMLLHLAGSSQRSWRSREAHVGPERHRGISPLPSSVWL